MAMEETWGGELNNPSVVDVSILDQELSHQDLQPYMQAPDAEQYFTGAGHDDMTRTLEAGSELEYNDFLCLSTLNVLSCSDDHNGGSEHELSEVIERDLHGHHEQHYEQTPDLLKKKMKVTGELQRRNRTSNWTEMQTEYLVECKKTSSIARTRLIRGNYASNDWTTISKKFSERFAGDPENFKTSKQCRLRWDTLLKAFKKIKVHCNSLGIEHTELTKEDLSKLELATTLRTDWYDIIDKFCPPRTNKGKNFALNCIPRDADYGLSANLSIKNGPASSTIIEVQAQGKEHIDIPTFDDLPNLMQRIILDFVFHDFNKCNLTEVCRWLALVHDEHEHHILACVLQLLHMNLIIPKYIKGESSIKFERMQSYRKFAYRVLKDKPEFRIHLNLRHIKRQYFCTTTQHVGLKMLDFHRCHQLNSMDLKNVPNLKSLTFNECPNLANVSGWEELTNLGRLDVTFCPKLNPITKNLKALKHFNMSSKISDGDIVSTLSEKPKEFDTRTMTNMGQYLDLNNLRTLENFRICHCIGLKTVEESFGSLSSLTECSFRGCHSLHTLPDLSNLIMLKHLDIQDTKIKTIPGLQNLKNLELLNCYYSEVKSLPDLSHILKLHVQPEFILKGQKSSKVNDHPQEMICSNEIVDGSPEPQEDVASDNPDTDWSD